MQIRDRVRELRRVRAGELRPNPRNWRTHPTAQRDALRGVLAEIGYADALVARECGDGALELIDGHLRAETTPDALVPVLVVDVDETEAAKLLAVLDPLAECAERDQSQLNELLALVETDNAAVQKLLDQLAVGGEPSPVDCGATGDASDDGATRCDALPESYQIVVECRDEAAQRRLFERLTSEGWKCRALVL